LQQSLCIFHRKVMCCCSCIRFCYCYIWWVYNINQNRIKEVYFITFFKNFYFIFPFCFSDSFRPDLSCTSILCTTPPLLVSKCSIVLVSWCFGVACQAEMRTFSVHSTILVCVLWERGCPALHPMLTSFLISGPSSIADKLLK